MQRFAVRYPEEAYARRVLYALELIDAVTLERVRPQPAYESGRRAEGVLVTAEGLLARQIVNASGIVVWVGKAPGTLRRIVVDPGYLPYARIEIPGDEIEPRKLKTVELTPTVGYPFSSGVTGLRGTLIESRVAPSERPIPVDDATMHVRWLDEDGATWRQAPVGSRTNANGDFAATLRLTLGDVPKLGTDGTLVVRLRVERPDRNPRESTDVAMVPGCIADPSTFTGSPPALTFAWDELQL